MARANRILLAAAMLTSGALAATAFGQDKRPERPAMQERGEVDPGRLESLIERRLDQTERQQARLREIKKRLADGESPAAILAELRERGELTLLGEWGRGGDREGQRGPRDGGEQRRFEDVGDEEFALWREKVLAFFDTHAPEMAKRLREEGDSEHANRAIFRLRREVDRLIELRDSGSDEFQPALERIRNGVRIADLLGRVRKEAIAGTLTPDLLRTLRRELTTIVASQFDAQLEDRAKWLARMGHRLEGAQEKLERERAERSQRVEAQVQAMIERAMKPEDEHKPPSGDRPDGGPRRGPR